MRSVDKRDLYDVQFYSENDERMLSTGLALKKQLFLAVNIRAGTPGKSLDEWPLIIVSYRLPVQKYQGDIASRMIRSIAWVKFNPDRSRAA